MSLTGTTNWLKLFHRWVFSTEGNVRGVEALGRICLGRLKSDIWVVKTS